MTQKDLKEGMLLTNVNGIISCMMVSFDSYNEFECAWCKLVLKDATLEIIHPKKKFGASGAYPWVKVVRAAVKQIMPDDTFTNVTPYEFLIPWSNLKPCLPKQE